MGKAERPMVPKPEFTSYYGKPIINGPVWRAPDIPGYLFLGGLAGASSLLAAGAQVTGRSSVVPKTVAFGGISLSLVALVHDLGRPARFVNMLRVFKPTSPMNVGSWILAGYGPLAGAAAASALTGKLPASARWPRREPRCWDRPWRLTRPRWSATPRFPRGTTGSARCRTSSSARRRARLVGWG
ncbi:hypothetical protein GCM10029964_069340 [Kibdelosporangium lantanae]